MSAQTIVSDGEFTPLDGWPCRPFLGGAPLIADRLTAPEAADLLPQILTLAPRGAAWGTDEADDGNGASPYQLRFWTALATWSAGSYARDADIAAQAFPSLVTWSLDDWENEYALPDHCITDPQTVADRLQAVRAKYALVGASSPDYLICLAASIGIDITITEYNPARIGAQIGDRIYGTLWGDTFTVTAPSTTVVPAYVGLARIGDRLASWGNAELECAINQAKQPQTVSLFAYTIDGGSFDPFTLDGGSGSGDPLA